jgi:hypothetical protein
MEGRGFLEAVHIDGNCRGVVVRGISDRLRGKTLADRQEWQQQAADAASAFFFAMLALAEGEPPTTSNLDGRDVRLLEKAASTMSNPRYTEDLSRLDRTYARNTVINRETIILVIGTTIPAELLDRPIAEALRDHIDELGKGYSFRRAIVITDDAWYNEASNISDNAVISIGGPPANRLSHEFDKWEAPEASNQGKYQFGDQQNYIGFFRMNQRGLPQVALWGVDATSTRQAVEYYMTAARGLDELLKMTWK